MCVAVSTSYAQIQNDNCVDAIDLGVMALNESRTVAYDLTYATDSGESTDAIRQYMDQFSYTTLSNLEYINKDLWYKFNSGDNTVFQQSSLFELFSECGMSLVSTTDQYGQYNISTNTEYILRLTPFNLDIQGSGIFEFPIIGGAFIGLRSRSTNNDCSTAESITLAAIGSSLALENVGASVLDPSPTSSECNDRGLFYSFTHSDDSRIRIDGSTYSELYKGSCAVKVSVGCDQRYYEIEANENYFLRLPQFGNHSITLIDDVQPNDICDGAIPITIGETYVYDSNIYNDEGNYVFNNEPKKSAYYTLVAPPSGNITVNLLGFSALRTIHSGTCLSPQLIKYFPPSQIRYDTDNKILNLTPGETYTLGFSLLTRESVNIIVSELESSPINNTCNTPTPIIIEGDAIDGNFELALASLAVDGLCPEDKDLWYSFSVTGSTSIEIIADYVNMQIFEVNASPSCEDYPAVTGCFGDERDEIILPNTGDYLLKVTKQDRAVPRDDFSIEINSLPVNTGVSNFDYCIDALPVDLPYSTNLFDEVNLASASNPIIPYSCNETFANLKDVWLTFTAPASGSVRIIGDYQIFSGEDCSSLIEVACSKGDTPSNLIPDKRYYMRIVENGSDRRFVSIQENTIVPSNNICNDFIKLNNLQSPQVIDLNSAGAFADFSINDVSCIGESRPDLWYYFKTNVDNEFLKIEPNADDITVTFYVGDCTSLTEVYCQDIERGTEVQIDLTVHDEWYMRIVRTDIGLMYHNVTIQLNEGYSLDDECSTATSLVLTEDMQALNLSDEIISISDQPFRTGYAFPDIWKSFTTGVTGNVAISDAPEGRFFSDLYVEIWEDCSDAYVAAGEMEFFNRGGLFFELEPNTDYVARFYTDETLESWEMALVSDLLTNTDCASAALASVNLEGSCEDRIQGHTYGVQSLVYEIVVPLSGAFKIQDLKYGEICLNGCGAFDVRIQDEEEFSGLTPGSSVFVRVYNLGFYDFCISELSASDIANQACSSSEDINVNAVCTMQNIEVRNVLQGRYYNFIASAESVKISSNILNNLNTSRIELNVYDACLGNRIYGNRSLDLDVRINNLTIGNQYEIELKYEVASNLHSACNQYDYESVLYNECIEEQNRLAGFEIDFCIESVPAPAVNDECINAINLDISDPNCNNAVSGDTQFASNTQADCGAFSRELFYTITPAEDMNMSLRTENANTLMQISIYEDDCSGRLLACTEDDLVVNVFGGETYLVAVAPFDNDEDTSFDLCATEIINLGGPKDNIGFGITDPAQSLHIEGAVIVGSSSFEFPGSIRYNGNDFQGYTNTGWKSLTSPPPTINEEEEQSTLDNTITNDGIPNEDNALVSEDGLGSHIAEQELDMQNFVINNLLTPTEDHQAVNKGYVDEVLQAVVPEEGLGTIENFNLEKSQDDNGGVQYDLMLESSIGTFSLGLNDLYNGWQYDDGSNEDPYIWNNGLKVGIGVEEPTADLQINGVTRFDGSSVNVTDIIADGEDLKIDLYNLNQTQTSPHFLLGNFIQGGNTSSFDFDVVGEKLGIGKSDPSASLHIDKNSVSNYTTIEKNGAVEFVIDGDAQLGLGTDDPEKLIDARGTIQSKMDSGSGNAQLNLVESNTGAARMYFDNNVNDPIALLGQPNANPDDAKFTIFVEGNVVSVTGEQRVGINNTSPDHPLEVGTNSGNGNGAHLTAGGTWTNMSSRTLKENFQSVNHTDILTKLAALNILKWDYKQSKEGTHLGPIAEEFYETFGLGNSEKSISTVDADGVALAAIKALHEENIRIKKELQELKILVESLLNKN